MIGGDDSENKENSGTYKLPPPKPVELPPAWHTIESSYETFVRINGEPITPDPRLLKRDFSIFWHNVPSSELEKLVLRWEYKIGHGMRLIPALGQIIFEYQRTKITAKKFKRLPDPKRIEDALTAIENNCKSIISNLALIHKSAMQDKDPLSPYKSAHIGWINLFIQNAITKGSPREIEVLEIITSMNIGEIILENAEETATFIDRLSSLAIAAKHVRCKKLDKKLLARKTGAREDPALAVLVDYAAAAWESLSKRKPSVSSRNIPAGDADPPFVQFVQQLVQLGGGAPPTRKQVASAMPKAQPQLQKK